MKLTLLELVQEILSSMDSDEVNSITDTTESLQVAHVVKNCYFDLISRTKLPEHYTLFNLEASGDNTKPTLMSMPDSFSEAVWIKYNTETTTDTDINMVLMKYLTLEDFLNYIHQFSESDTNVGTFEHTVGTSTFTVLYKDDKAPQFYTSFDDSTILFDSYDSDVDTTLQGSKTLCYGRKVIDFALEDGYTPDLDENHFSLLLNEAKTLAWTELKQSQHPKAELNARRGWVGLQKTVEKVKTLSDFDKLPNFGRK